jgi:hypothetical protein
MGNGEILRTGYGDEEEYSKTGDSCSSLGILP